ncbi:MAG: hemerythrin family protein [Desulfobacterales bacterium]|nr:hemerythrin family protein [Desulfobacterales bacterium]
MDKKIEWEDQFSVQIHEFDEQHKHIVNMINKLIDAKHSGENQKILSEVIHEMTRYLDFHFGNEHKYMIEFDYPHYQEHMLEHRKFITKTIQFRMGFRDDDPNLIDNLLNFLKQWLFEHIMTWDKSYTLFFHEKGLK